MIDLRNMSLPDMLCSLRVDLGLTQAQAAARIGVHTSTVMCWEIGRFRPREKHLKVIARAYGVSIKVLREAIP